MLVEQCSPALDKSQLRPVHLDSQFRILRLGAPPDLQSVGTNPVACTIAFHRSDCDAISQAKSPREIASSSTANFAMPDFTSSVRRAAWMEALSFSTTFAGVFAGTKIPYQVRSSSDEYPASPTVGTAGRNGLRCGPVVASARRSPER